jgi:hypothetical protein
MKSLEEKLHEKGVRELNDRLVAKGYYDIVLRNPCYFTPDTGAGELDVIAIKDNVMHYYEVKLHGNKHSRQHARQQYQRVCEAFPNMQIKGIYVPLDGNKPIRRL